MPNWIPIVAATLAAIPAAAVFFLSYGRYDGAFQDRVVFLYFMGGLILGAFLGFLSLLLLNTVTALIVVIGLSLIFPIAIVAVINRRKWQGERHAVFNGGAAGLGVAIMMGFSHLYFRMSRPYVDAQRASDAAWQAAGNALPGPAIGTAAYAFDLALVGQGILFAAGLAGLFFGMGLLAGDGVRRRRQFLVAFLGTAILVAPVIFLEEFSNTGVWTWAILLAAYGAIFAYAADRKLLEGGVSDEARRQRRRLRRKAQD